MKIFDLLGGYIKAYKAMTQGIQLAIMIVIIAVAFSFGGCEGDKQIKDFTVKYGQLQSEAKSAKAFADSAKTKIATLTTDAKSKDSVITKLTTTVQARNKERDKLKGDLNSLEGQLSAETDTAKIVNIQKEVIVNLKGQVASADSTIHDQESIIDSQKYKITKLDSAVVLANTRGDKLQVVVDSLINLPAPKVPKPWISKKTAITIGFVVGVLVGDQLARR